MQIKTYNSKYGKSVVSLIKNILVKEFRGKFNSVKDYDLYHVEEIYKKPGGNFWIAISLSTSK